MERNNFFGLDKFIWWVGEIPITRHDLSLADPFGIGRCRVRIFGWHTDDESLLPNEDLPWAHPLLPINNPNVNSPGNAKEGDWIVGFFMDGESAQMPIMMGVLPGIVPTDY
jgi:hypothetical protein